MENNLTDLIEIFNQSLTETLINDEYLAEKIIEHIQKDITDEEKLQFENVLNNQWDTELFTLSDIKSFKTLKDNNLIHKISDYYYFISPTLFNAYNKLELNSKYEDLPLLGFYEKIEIERAMKIENKRDLFNDTTLIEAMEIYEVEDLKVICRNYGIRGFSNKNKQELISLINKHFFADDRIINEILVDSISAQMLKELVIAERNSIVDVGGFRRGSLPFIMIDYAYHTPSIIYIPADVKHFIKDKI
ncbi:hypothetical protein [Staphylococcus caeli]|uniref:Rho termination factor N-terminal domain-containing protein n=1 Tax=Staphylococcus caeli TaxID=2201815 RepID=A0A1D4LLB7_9STAP|nr:hypothetical protein [Staphylococcus caeli]SCS65756.1 Uncharacterised protein [Staphylococcus caeli]SCS87136.1 Uncharacterised protein [Staphylococcus caeli]